MFATFLAVETQEKESRGRKPTEFTMHSHERQVHRLFHTWSFLVALRRSRAALVNFL